MAVSGLAAVDVDAETSWVIDTGIGIGGCATAERKEGRRDAIDPGAKAETEEKFSANMVQATTAKE